MTESLALTDDDLPLLFRSADSSSKKAQKAFNQATKIRLIALLVAAAGGTVVVKADRVDLAGIIAACAFISAVVVEVYLLRTRPDRAWFEGRAVAESAKTLAWRYAVGGEPFPTQNDDPQRMDGFLGEQLRATFENLKNVRLAPPGGGGAQITDAMRKLRQKSLAERRSAYEEGRIDDQLDWYSGNAKSNEDRTTMWASGLLVVELLGGIGAVAKAIGALEVDVLGLAAALAAAGTAWLQTKQHQTLAEAYGIAAQELGEIKSQIEWQDTEDKWQQFVDDAEKAISREHTLWKASRGIGPVS